MALRTAAESRSRQAHLTAAVLAQARRQWSQVDFVDLDGSWPRFASRLLLVLTAGQHAAATEGAAAVGRMLTEQHHADDPAGEVNAEAFAGVASDGRRLDTLLYQPVIATKSAIGNGAGQSASLASGGAVLDRIVHTQMFDAYRVAAGVGITVRHGVGQVRQLNPPSCTRCAILAGKWYRWDAGFDRHVHCDCIGIPAAENVARDLTTDPVEAVRAGNVTGLSNAERNALHEGADLGQLVNVHRQGGIYTAGGRTFTREGRSRFRARLTPEQIYRDANSRDDAIRLLRRFGYIT
jgi:hypothetical protein